MNIIDFLKQNTGLSLVELAEKLGEKYITLYSYSTGNRKLPTKLLLKIHQTFNISWKKIGELLK